MINRRELIAAGIATTAVGYPLIGYAAPQIQRLNGAVFINNRIANLGSAIHPGDHIVVGARSELEFVLNDDAFRLGPQTALTITGSRNAGIRALRLLTGALMGVFGRRERRLPVHTAFATIGIRGTAVFLNTKPTHLYTCTCYGTTDLIAGSHNEVITSTHHNPHTVDRHQSGTMTMASAEMKDHDDGQLRRLEAYVGRVPAFDR